MKTLFPETLDGFNLPDTRANRNLAETTLRISFADILYILSELEKKVGINSSEDTTSLDYKLAKAVLAGLLGFGTGNFVVGMKSDGTAWEYKEIAGVADETDIVHSASKIVVGIVNPLKVTKGGTGTATQFTLGSVVFVGANGVYTQDNANFFWDDTNNRLRIADGGDIVHKDLVYPKQTVSGTNSNRTILNDVVKFDDAAGTNTRFVVHYWLSSAQFGAPAAPAGTQTYTVTKGTSLIAFSAGALNTAITDANGDFELNISNTHTATQVTHWLNIEVQGIVYSTSFTLFTGDV